MANAASEQQYFGTSRRGSVRTLYLPSYTWKGQERCRFLALLAESLQCTIRELSEVQRTWCELVGRVCMVRPCGARGFVDPGDVHDGSERPLKSLEKRGNFG